MKFFIISTIFILIITLGATVIAQQPPSQDCLGGVPSVYHNDRWWAWASPCSGGCSFASPDTFGYDQYGWRWVSGNDEWSLRPDKSLFEIKGDYVGVCASSFFDPSYTHCDAAGTPVYLLDGENNELWLVRDKCDVDNEVPEFTNFAAVIILIGAGIFIATRKKK